MADSLSVTASLAECLNVMVGGMATNHLRHTLLPLKVLLIIVSKYLDRHKPHPSLKQNVGPYVPTFIWVENIEHWLMQNQFSPSPREPLHQLLYQNKVPPLVIAFDRKPTIDAKHR